MLPSGRILGHRSLKVYYNQRLAGDSGGPAVRSRVNDKIVAVRQRLADPSQALISIAGGHGAYGKGLEVMRARNAGEATWAKKQARSHLDQKRREAFRTAVGYKHNNQKREWMQPNVNDLCLRIRSDFRDPLREFETCRYRLIPCASAYALSAMIVGMQTRISLQTKTSAPRCDGHSAFIWSSVFIQPI